MKSKIEEIKALKRYLKKKISITEALVVMFLITGGVSYSATITPATEMSKSVEQKTISSEIIEKFKNPKNEKEYFEYKVSFKDGADKEKVLKELKAHVIEKQPKYLNEADAREESILTQEMQGYKGLSVENYLSNNNAKLTSFEKTDNTNKILAGGVGLLGAVVAAISIFDHDSDSDNGNNSADPPVDPPVDPIDPPVDPIDPPVDPPVDPIDPPTTPSNVVIINGKEVILGTDTVSINNLNITAPTGLLAVGVGTNAIMTGDTTISSQENTIAAMALNGGTITNTGNITLSQSGDIGMLAQNTTPSSATFSTSLYALPIQTTVINEGNIGGIGNIAMKSDGLGATALNGVNGTITVGSFGTEPSYGIYSINSGSALNDGKISNSSISGNSYGIYADGVGSTAVNRSTGLISNTSDTGYSYGMYADAEGTAKNEGSILNSSTSGRSYGMYANGSGSTVINESTGTISNHSDSANSYGMYANGLGSTALNYGTISNTISSTATDTAFASTGMFASTGGTVTNYGTISNESELVIANTSTSIGMRINGGGTAINNEGATIANESLGSSTGIQNDNNSGMALNYGTISNYGVERSTGIAGSAVNHGTISNSSELYASHGMEIGGNGATALNEGIISNTSTLGASFGMFANEGATIVNNGKISNESFDDSYGMEASGAGTTAKNYGTISNISTGAKSVGMKASNGAMAVNEVEGVIDVNTADSYGMYATGNGATIINQGTINLNADNGTGMYADNGATLDNQGTINLDSTNGTGIHATGEGTVVKNSGEIYIAGDEVSNEASELVAIDENGNQAMKIEDGATFVNNGLLMVEGELDTTEITENGGQVVIEGGTIEAETIRGDYYASGALAMGGYENTYDTYQMFKADNMYANIYSNSAMFNVELTPQDDLGYYGVAMTRKSFNEILDNSGYAQYLENNYTAANNTTEKEDLYDAYKLVVSESDLNDAVDETFGNTIYPTLMYQTLSAIRDINNDIKDNVFGRNQFAELNGVRYIGFGKYRDSEVSFDDNRLTEYDREMSTVTLGADKAINDNIRLGALLTVGKADYDFDNGDSREDDMYQFNLIGSYEKDNVLATATAYLGKTDGDLDRTVAFTSIYEEMEGDVENSYYGIDLSLEKRYDLTSFNISPRVELNTIHVEQDDVNEKGTYALDVEKTEATSVEGGLGFQIDRTFDMGNGYKLTPVFSAMYYREFADPYEDSTATLSSVSSDKIKIESYDAEDDRGEFYGALELEKNGLGATVGVNHSVDSEGDETTPFVGIGYTF